MSQSLKANKAQAHAPSKAETILTDSVKLSLAPIVSEATTAYQFGIDHEKLVMSKQEKEQAFAHSFVSYVKDNALSYSSYQAAKKHVQTSIAISKKQEPETVEKWLNKIVKSYIAIADLGGYTLPKSESKNAESMSKLRAELSSIDDNALQAQIEQLAKAGDFKKASQLATEKQKREKQAVTQAKKTESKASTELKGVLKRWIGSADTELLAALLWAKNHQAQIIKLSKA
jgi:ribosomal protein L22